MEEDLNSEIPVKVELIEPSQIKEEEPEIKCQVSMEEEDSTSNMDLSHNNNNYVYVNSDEAGLFKNENDDDDEELNPNLINKVSSHSSIRIIKTSSLFIPSQTTKATINPQQAKNPNPSTSTNKSKKCISLADRRPRMTVKSDSYEDNLPYICPVENCSESFSSPVYYKHHLASYHNFFYCTSILCKETFSSESQLNQHITSIHGKPLPPKKSAEIRSKRLKLKQNPNLMSNNTNKNNNIVPILPRHPNYNCKSCSVKFETERDLKSHVEAHSKGQILKCSICRRSFNMSLALFHEHMMEHRHSSASSVPKSKSTVKKIIPVISTPKSEPECEIPRQRVCSKYSLRQKVTKPKKSI